MLSSRAASADRTGRRAGLPPFDGVLGRKVRALACFQHEVGGSVVQSVAIVVMDYLDARQEAPERGLHDEAVLHHPSRLRRVRMIGSVDLSVGLPVADSDLARGSDVWCLVCADVPSVAQAHRCEAVGTDGEPCPVRPAVDDRGALRALEQVVGCWFHTDSLLRDKRERNSKQQQEWLTMNRSPVSTVATQTRMFG